MKSNGQKTDTVEERLEVRVPVGLGVDVRKEVGGKLNIPSPSVDDLNTLVGTFAGYHRKETA